MDIPSSTLSLLESYRERIKLLEKRLQRLNLLEVSILDEGLTLVSDERKMFFDGISEFIVTYEDETIYAGGDWDDALKYLLLKP